jgi:hypothetical protein
VWKVAQTHTEKEEMIYINARWDYRHIEEEEKKVILPTDDDNLEVRG